MSMLKVEDIHVRRNVQRVKKRDSDLNSVGRKYTFNQTKTYSGDRIIPLNNAATEAIENMVERFPDSKYIVCNSKGNMIPPDHLDRTFYRLLNNVGIKKTGVHSLRHTFASLLFASGANVRTVSELMGHSSTYITENIYIHLIQEHKASTINKVEEFLSQ